MILSKAKLDLQICQFVDLVSFYVGDHISEGIYDDVWDWFCEPFSETFEEGFEQAFTPQEGLDYISLDVARGNPDAFSPKPSEWLPIESIPLDTYVLTADTFRGIVIRRLYDDGKGNRVWYQAIGLDEGADEDPPTHWQPLPKFP